jgi:hypothetical protein
LAATIARVVAAVFLKEKQGQNADDLGERRLLARRFESPAAPSPALRQQPAEITLYRCK